MTDRDLTLGEAEAYSRALRDAAAVCDRTARHWANAAHKPRAEAEGSFYAAREIAAAILALEPRAGGEVYDASVNLSAARIAELEAERDAWRKGHEDSQATIKVVSAERDAAQRDAWQRHREGYAAGAAAMREAAARAFGDAPASKAVAADIRALPLPDAALGLGERGA